MGKLYKVVEKTASFGRRFVRPAACSFLMALAVVEVLPRVALAGSGSGPAPTPEIDPSSAAAALAILAGVVLIARGRRRSA
jgi:hypothetical protein